MTAPAYLRVLFAAALVAIVSGLPQAGYAVLVDDCCAERCESERDGKSCPPNCPSASCLKVFPSAIPQSRGAAVASVPRREPRADAVVGPELPLVLSGVFHPPRR